MSIFILLICQGKPVPQLHILIVGGGFSGAMLAVHLLHQSSSLSVAVIDPGSLPGRGLAYSSPRRFHLLNVPAGEMSAFPDLPDDFLRWGRNPLRCGNAGAQLPAPLNLRCLSGEPF